MSDPTLEYNEADRIGVITFPNGHKLRVKGVDKTKADEFFQKHAKEFQKRDCVLHTSACVEVRHG